MNGMEFLEHKVYIKERIGFVEKEDEKGFYG
jgi:hypothetical protein